MTQDELKAAVAREAMKYVVEDAVIGVGTGSTADLFIDELAKMKGRILGTVASSERSAARLKKHGLPVLDLKVTDVTLNAEVKIESPANQKQGGAAPAGALRKSLAALARIRASCAIWR